MTVFSPLSCLLQVHVNLLLMEARMQAELLYALRAITRYMTWSAFGVFFIVVFLLSMLLLIMGHFKKKKSKGGIQQKCGRDVRSPGLWRLYRCWMDVEKRIKNKMKARKKNRERERTVDAKSSQTTSGYTNSVRVACSAKTDQERAAWSKLLLSWGGVCVLAGPLTPEASRTTFQYSSLQHIGCQSLLSPGRVKTHKKNPESCAARNSLHLDSVVTVCLVSLISFYFILYQEKWMLLSMWLLLVVTGDGSIILAGVFTCAWTIQHSVHTCWCCCSHIVFSGVILIPKSPPPQPHYTPLTPIH